MVQDYTYLGLVNEVLQQFNETLLTSSNFSSATGFHAVIQESVNTAIADIYEEEDYVWPFAYVLETETLLTDGTQDYALNSGVAKVDWNTMYLEYDAALTSKYQKDLIWKDWHSYTDEGFKNRDENSVSSTDYGKPDIVTRTPQNYIRVSPKPDEAYTLRYDSWSYPTELTTYTDVPSIPEAFANTIISGAKIAGYRFRDNEEQARQQEEIFKDKINRMRRVLIPQSDYIRSEV